MAAQTLTVTGEGHRLLGVGDFDRNLDGVAGVTPGVSLGDDGAQDVARVGGHVAMREGGTQAEESQHISVRR